jgi:DNA-binding transcriptional MerR regulator
MSELAKIRDISTKYDVSARTLRYYEDMGLIKSTRSDDYAYRLYDDAAVRRLEQILILRKLSISVKDIKRIFETTGSDVVLEVLGKKIDAIDDEVALLHELKEIVLDFIRQIEQADFAKESDVKLLYEKAKEIETQIVDYNGNPSNVNRLIEITEKLDKKIPDVLIIRLPKCLALVSKYTRDFGELFGGDANLMGWMGNNRNLENEVIYDCADFLCRRINGEFRWLFAVNDTVKTVDTAQFEVIDFKGGLYASAVCINDDHESIMKVEDKILKWLESTNFVHDTERDIMGNMPFLDESEDDEIMKGLGYHQLLRFIPIKLKG